jgi:hypothetical protein
MTTDLVHGRSVSSWIDTVRPHLHYRRERPHTAAKNAGKARPPRAARTDGLRRWRGAIEKLTTKRTKVSKIFFVSSCLRG